MRACFLAFSVGAMTLVFGGCLAWAGDPLDTWAKRYVGPVVRDVAFGGDRFVAVGDAFYDSPDGMCWARRPLDNPGMNNGLWGVAYGNGRFVAVESGKFFTESRVFVSTNGTTWQLSAKMPAGQLPVIDRVYFGGGSFLAVGEEANPSSTPGYHWLLMSSSDGFNWTRHSGPTNSGESYYLNAATYGDGLYLLGGWATKPDKQGLLLTSTNLHDWVPVTDFSFSSVNGLAYGNSQFIAVGADSWPSFTNQIATSPDGLHWSNQVPGVKAYFSSVAFGKDTFVVVGEPELILSSGDGVNWRQHSTTVEALKSVTYGEDSFVAVGGYYTDNERGVAVQSGGKPQICLEALGWVGSSSTTCFNLVLKAEGGPYRLQYSPSLPGSLWEDLRTNIVMTPYPDPAQFCDSTAPRTGQRFYRIVSP